MEDAFRAGFQNVSLDLMLGIPQQTAEDVETSIQFCADTGVQHISAYLLKIEPGTPSPPATGRKTLTPIFRRTSTCGRWTGWSPWATGSMRSPTSPAPGSIAATT